MKDMAVIRTGSDLDNDPRLVRGLHGYYLKTNPDCLYVYVPGGLADRPQRWHEESLRQLGRLDEVHAFVGVFGAFVAGAVAALAMLVLFGWRAP